uniref:AAA+ ATPase domain-containing protein n=1 Tax=Salix viminalis TaxID=40686 RepID=A0A6N2LW72_SALVM
MAPLLQSSQPWVEKYRPKQVKDVAHQDEVVRVLTNTLETTNCPHMLFYGPPGTGKTTTALAIAHQLYGPELYKSRVLELNASDDRGINVVRTKIKDFAAVANALRRTMETYSKVTRFFFICNYISRIIEPLASRCAKFRFKPLPEEIMSNQGLTLDTESLSTLSSISQGDLRRAITYLQGAARLFGSSISSKDLISVSGAIPVEVTEAIIAACKSGDFDLANKEVNNVIAEGYPVSQMLAQLFEMVVAVDDISDEQKARICKSLSTADKCLVDGADEYLQLLDVVSNTMRALCNMPQEFSYDI